MHLQSGQNEKSSQLWVFSKRAAILAEISPLGKKLIPVRPIQN
jgi:hypothetical protein